MCWFKRLFKRKNVKLTKNDEFLEDELVEEDSESEDDIEILPLEQYPDE